MYVKTINEKRGHDLNENQKYMGGWKRRKGGAQCNYNLKNINNCFVEVGHTGASL